MKAPKTNRRKFTPKRELSFDLWGGFVLNSYHASFSKVSRIAQAAKDYLSVLSKDELEKLSSDVYNAFDKYFISGGYFKYYGYKYGTRKDLEKGFWVKSKPPKYGSEFVKKEDLKDSDVENLVYKIPSKRLNKKGWFNEKGVMIPESHLPGLDEYDSVVSDPYLLKHGEIKLLDGVNPVYAFSMLAIIKINDYAGWAELREDTRDETEDETWLAMIDSLVDACEAVSYAKEAAAEQKIKDLLNHLNIDETKEPQQILEHLERDVLRKNASKAGKAKSLKHDVLKKYVIKLFKEGKFASANNAAEKIWAEIQKNNSNFPPCYLSKTRGKATIYEWLRNSK